MKKKLVAYLEKLNNTEYSKLSEKDKKELKGELLVQIQFFQHERLIHLIVTALFAILEVLSLLVCVIHISLYSCILSGLFFILLIPYIYHYYILENGVQEMYKNYDQINEELKRSEEEEN